MQRGNILYDKKLTVDLKNKFILGDDEAYAALYKLYVNELYAYGMFICNNKLVVEDAIHDVFTALFANRKILANVENIKYYLITSTRNRLFYLLKKDISSYEIDYKIDEKFSSEQNYQEDWIQDEEANERETLVKNLLNNLNEHQKDVLYKRFVDGMSLEEISKTMDINYQSVKNLIQRSLTKIRKSIAVSGLVILPILFLRLLCNL